VEVAVGRGPRDAPLNTRAATRTLLLAAAVGCNGCGSTQRALTAQRVGLTSLNETAAMVGAAWLSGHVTSTYARIAFEAAEQQLARQQAELSADLELLATPDGASLSQSEERLSRTLASLSVAVASGDSSGFRRRLGELDVRQSRP
jgi:hypothetical protein